MGGEWRKTTIGAAFEVNPPRPLKRGSVAPFIPMDVLPLHARAVERIEVREYTGSGMRFRNGDTLIARITPCLENGKTAFVSGLRDGEVAHGSTEYIVLSGKSEESDSLFGYYLARSPDFRSYAIGHMEGTSGRQRVPSSAIERFQITLPPIGEQRAIAHILGTLDGKIELNRKQNETLEAMARALFKDWFVDFGPVRAKMEGRWQKNSPLPLGEGAGVRVGEGPGVRDTPRLNPQLLSFARELRQNATDAEQLLWRLLRNRQLGGAKFRRQHPLPPYILDFYCHEAKLAIELDGGQHNEPAARSRDAERDAFLNQHGIRVLRFWNHEVLRETEAVLEAIYAAVGGLPSPQPLSQGERGYCLPAHLYDLFPDRLVESELGEIPEGWGMTSLSEYSALNPESWTKRTRPAQIRYVDLSNAKWGRIESVTNYESDDAPSRAQRVLRPLDTIVGTVRPGNGSYALVFDEGLTGSTGFAVMRPLQREYCELVYLAATARENIERLANLADGGAYPAIRPETVSATQVPRTGKELIMEFSRKVSPMLAGIAESELESRTLAQLRDTLLPKLISGELRVRDAEAFLKERGL